MMGLHEGQWIIYWRKIV